MHRTLTALCVGLWLPLAAWADCERPLVVPVSDMGPLVKVGRQVAGAFPAYLRQVGERVGCRFEFVPTPRPRAERLMFEHRSADVFLPATQSATRDRDFVFVPLFRQTLGIAVRQGREADVPDSLEALLQRTDLRAAFVRGVFLGPDYASFVQAMLTARRADLVSDWATLGRMLRAERISFSIVPLPVAEGSFDDGTAPSPGDAIVLRQIRPVDAIVSGLYLSRRIPAADLASLQAAFARSLADGEVTRAFAGVPGGVTPATFRP